MDGTTSVIGGAVTVGVPPSTDNKPESNSHHYDTTVSRTPGSRRCTRREDSRGRSVFQRNRTLPVPQPLRPEFVAGGAELPLPA